MNAREYDDRMTRTGALTPQQQLKILGMIWGEDGEGGYVFLPWIPGHCKTKEQRKKNWNEGRAYEWPHEAAAILDHLRSHQRDDLYFSVSTFLGKSRVSQDAGEETTLWADLDEVNPRTDIDRSSQPTIAWETSPGRFQGVWLMRGMNPGASEMGGLNHKLTAWLGADPSGWDTTQLLRVPGRKNHKPDNVDEAGNPTQGRLVWVRSKRFSWEFFNELPDVYTFDLGGDSIEEAQVNEVDRHEVWGRVRLKCSAIVRQYMAMRARDIGEDHDRSEILWQIERDLADAGCTVLEIMAVVRATPWNKYDGRRNELTQLRAEAIKAKGVVEEDKNDKPLEEVVFDGSRPEKLLWLPDLVTLAIPRPSWIVHNIWTRGSVGFISGQPKSYKSYLGLDMSISVAIGAPFLGHNQFNTGQARRVLYLQEEDTLSLVLQRAEQIVEGRSPTHHWHGVLTTLSENGRSVLSWGPPMPILGLALHVRTGFVVSDPAWQAWLDEMIAAENIELVVIDTLGATAGVIDLDKASVINEGVLHPLKEIAERNDCAIAVVHHNRKSNADSDRAGQSMLGSTALHAWTESALYVRNVDRSNSSAVLTVERENKQAEDMVFRITVPPMFIGRGNQEAARQVWQPSISYGKVDTNKPDHPKTTVLAGAKITYKLREMSGGKPVPFDRIVQVIAQGQAAVRRQLNNAEGNGLVIHDQSADTYSIKG